MIEATVRLGCCVQRSAELDDLDEVVEVSRLEACVLAVVDEGQELASIVVEILDLAQRSDDALTDDADGRSAAFAVERRLP